MEGVPPNARCEDGSESADIIASINLSEVGSLLKELNVALPALQRVLDRVVSGSGGAKRKRGLDKEEIRPAKLLVTSADSIDTQTATDLKLLPGTPAQDAETLPLEAETAAPEVSENAEVPNNDGKALERDPEIAPVRFDTDANGGAEAGVVAEEKSADGVVLTAHTTERTQADRQSADASAEREGETTHVEGSYEGRDKRSFDGGAKSGVNGNEALLDRTSVILLTLSQLAKVRAGRPPTEVENNLMAEAYENVYSLVSKVLPKELVSKRAVSSFMHFCTGL